MTLSEIEFNELVEKVKQALATGSQGVGDVPEAVDLNGISTLPAYQEVEGQDIPNIVRAPLTLLAAPALEASKIANEEEAKRTVAETGRVTAEEQRVTEFSKIKTDAEKATDDAIAATGKTNEATQNANVATNAANAATAAANQAAIEANKSAENAEGKAQAAQDAADNANDTAEHPTYIGQDHYVYKWNKTTSSYDKTDIYTKGDAFSIKKVYSSVAELEADADNTGIAEGDFVLVNTGDVENPDNAKLYVKTKSDAGVYSYEFLVDMSGAIGFTGKTPQFSMGTISTLEAGSSATATVSEDGVDSDGNPKYKINFAIPRGNPGAPFNPVGQYDTLELLQAAIPDGSGVNGMIAVGTEAPYEYYAWLNGGWVNQGKIAGGGSGNVVAIPFDVVNLSNQSSSAEIFNAFGGKDAFMDICKKIFSDDVVCVISIVDGTDKIAYTSSVANASYIDENNALLVLEISDGGYMIINTTVNVTNGLATVDIQTINLVEDAPSDGNTYGRKNQDWVEVPGKSDVLTKTNTTEYTPTGDYQPATKKFVDTSLSDNRGIGYMMTKTVIDATGLDENTWYPVVMSLGGINTVRIEIIARLYQSNAPSWTTHLNGFSVRKIWEANGLDWYAYEAINRKIFVSEYKWADSDPVRGVGQFTYSNNEYVFVRGGGRYFFFTSHNVIPVLHTGTYEIEGQSVSPTTEEPALIVANMPTKEYVDNISYGKVINGSPEILNNCNLTGAEAEAKIITLFGSTDAFKQCVADMIDNHTKYFYNYGGNIFNICGTAWISADRNAYELYFTYNYPNLTNYLNKRATLRYSDASIVVIQDISTDDKLKTMFADITQSPEQDLNNINGFGIMSNSVDHFATPERNYPLQQAGTLFYGKAAYGSSNQIYGSFSSNRWFARGGGSGPTKKTSWREFAFKDDISKKLEVNSDLNNFKTVGVYWQSDTVGLNTVSNKPSGTVGEAVLQVYECGPNYVVQTYYNITDEKMFVRFYHVGTWGSWKSIVTEGGNVFNLEGFDFNTATQAKKEEFIKWVKGYNQIARIVHDSAEVVDDLYIPISSYKIGDYGTGEIINLEFIAIGAREFEIYATIAISVNNPDTGYVDINSIVNIKINRYNISPDFIGKYIVTSDTPTL